MAIGSDFTIDYDAKTITHTSGSTVYSVNALYSYLMDTFDELAQMDDSVPMSAQTPTEYTLINGWTIPDASFPYLKSGAIKTSDNNNLWANVYTLGSIQSGTVVYIFQNGSILSNWNDPAYTSGHIDALIKVKASGSLIDSGDIVVLTRELSDSYDNFKINLASGGRNAVPLATSDDLNNQTSGTTLNQSPYTGITLTFSSTNHDLNNGNGSKPYKCVIDCNALTLAQVYERLKYITSRGQTGTINSIQGQYYRAADSSYIGTTSEIKPCPFGNFAGGKFFGARGIWITNYDANDAKNFQLVDANGDTQAPPNVVSVIVNSVVSGDRVFVAELVEAGGVINTAKYSGTDANTSGQGAIVVDSSIASYTPAAGTVRINGDRYAYTSWTGSTFTLSGTLSTTYSEGADVYVPFIDGQASGTSISNTLIYASDVPVLVRVRIAGIIPFEVPTTISSTGLSVSAIRTTDSIFSE